MALWKSHIHVLNSVFYQVQIKVWSNLVSERLKYWLCRLLTIYCINANIVSAPQKCKHNLNCPLVPGCKLRHNSFWHGDWQLTCAYDQVKDGMCRHSKLHLYCLIILNGRSALIKKIFWLQCGTVGISKDSSFTFRCQWKRAITRHSPIISSNQTLFGELSE